MTSMLNAANMRLSIVILIVLVSRVSGDFDCFCNYEGQLVVRAEPTPTARVAGYLETGQCKAAVNTLHSKENEIWVEIVFHHAVGYVQKHTNVSTELCQGNPLAVDTIETTPQTTTPVTSTPTTTSATTRITQSTTSATTNSVRTTMKPTTGPTSGQSAICPTTWVVNAASRGSVLAQNGGSCYELVNIKHHWRRAESYCAAQGGHLLSVGSQAEENFILAFLRVHNFNHSIWIGLSDIKTEEHFEWTSGIPVTYTNWTPGRKGNYYSSSQEDCVLLVPSLNHRGEWDDIPCGSTILFGIENQAHYFVCQIVETTPQTTTPVTSTPTTTSATTRITQSTATPTTTKIVRTTMKQTTGPTSGQSAICPTTWVVNAASRGSVLAQNGGSCYELVNIKHHWRRAESYCAAQGGHLLSVGSQAEENFILAFLRVHNFNHSIWIGLSDITTEEHFEWTSGIPVTYTNWTPGRKGNYYSSSQEDCVLLVPSLNHRGEWDDIPCGSTILFGIENQAHYFVCQIGTPGAVALPSVQTTSGLPAPASGDVKRCSTSTQLHAQTRHYALEQHGRHCYELIPRSLSWSGAENYCSSNGGHLAHIGNVEDQAFFLHFLRNNSYGSHAVWLGLHDRSTEETFQWISGDPVTFTHWRPGRLSNFYGHGTEDCVVFIPYREGEWDDIPCGNSGFLLSGDQYPFVCQFDTEA